MILNDPEWSRMLESIRFLDVLRLSQWLRCYNGMVPAKWENWINIRADFEDAGKRGIQLSKTLVNAGLSYPHPAVKNAAGESQKLTTTQIAFLFIRDPRNRQDILIAQKQKGVSDKAIKVAEQKAESFKEKIDPHYHLSPLDRIPAFGKPEIDPFAHLSPEDIFSALEKIDTTKNDKH